MVTWNAANMGDFSTVHTLFIKLHCKS